MSAQSTIIATKLSLPKLKANILKRDRLLNILKHSCDYKLVLVSASAGYGKTTLLSNFVSELEHPYVWYDLDKTDRDIAVFLTRLVAGVGKNYSGFGANTKSIIEHNANIAQNMESAVGTFINEIVDTVQEDLFIILDDYHVLDRSKSVNEMIDYLLLRMPDNLHLIISTRTKPHLSIPRLKAKQEMIKLNKEDLRFTIEEMEALFKDVYGLDVSYKEMERLVKYSEGWITAIQLVSQDINVQPDKGIKESLNGYKASGRTIFDYFASEVFKYQTEKICKFLTQSSILDRLEPEVCNSILNIDDSQKILRSLERKNLFTSQLDKQGRYFKYHKLFREFLITRLTEDYGKDVVNKFHLKAANYFEAIKDLPEAGGLEQAVNHYIKADEYEEAARVIESVAQSMIKEGKFDTINHWIDSLPGRVVNTKPWLLCSKGCIFRYWGRWDEALELQQKANQLFEKEHNKPGICYTLHQIGVIMACQGDYESGIRIARQALELVEHNKLQEAKILNLLGVSYRNTGSYPEAVQMLAAGLKSAKELSDIQTQAAIMQNLAAVYSDLGEFSKSMEMYQKALHLLEHKSMPETAMLYNNIGTIYEERGEYLKAKDAFNTAVKISKEFNNIRIETYTRVNLGVLHQDLGDFEKAMENYEQALNLTSKLGKTPISSFVWQNLSILYLLMGDFRKANEYINKISGIEDNKPANLQAALFLITKGRIELEVGGLAVAEEIFTGCLNVIEMAGAKYHLMRVHFYLAKLGIKKSSQELVVSSEVRNHIERTLELAKKNEYHHFLISEGKRDTSVLEFAIKNKINPEYVIYILSEIGSTAIPVLTSLLEHRDKKIRRLAVECLGKTGDERAIEHIEKLALGEKDDSVRAMSRQVLRNMALKEEPKSAATGNYDMIIHLFGGAKIIIGGIRVLGNKWRLQKAKKLFCYLAANKGKLNSKDKLMDLFWQNANIWKAENNLHSAIRGLRKVLNIGIDDGVRYEFIIYDAHCYSLNPEYSYWIDVEEFENLMKEAEQLEDLGDEQKAVEKYEQAIELYRGEYLENLYDPWCEQNRAYYEEAYLKALRISADYYFSNGEYLQAIKYYEKILTVDEFQEEVYCMLMRCYAKTGERKKITKEYQRLKNMLKKEFNEPPSTEITSLYKKLIHTPSI